MTEQALKGLVAQKIGMTRFVDSDGVVTPVTLLKVTPQKNNQDS